MNLNPREAMSDASKDNITREEEERKKRKKKE